MSDIFAKCARLENVRQAQAGGYYPYFLEVGSAPGPEVIVDGRRMVLMTCNDYLGLATHADVVAAARAAIDEYGTTAAASRFLSGTLPLHTRLEAELSAFFGKEAALVFATGMQANLGAISALVGRGDTVITDKYDHASIIDGCRLALGNMRRFAHNDAAALKRVLDGSGEGGGRLVIVDGVYSMHGDIADLPAIIQCSHAAGAGLLLDDAHGVGVLGDGGRGTAEYYGLLDQTDLIMISFSKSLASIGGAIIGPTDVIDYIKHAARAMIFSAALPAASVAAARASLEVLQHEPERREILRERSRFLADGLRAAGFDTGRTASPIVPIMVPSQPVIAAFWRRLYDEGIFVSIIIPPAVPAGHELLRLSVSYAHSRETLERVIDACRRAGREVGLIE